MFVFVCFESQKLTKRRKQLQLCEEHCRHTKRILNTNQLLLLLGKELGRKRLEPSEWKIWIEHESGERSRYILNISKEKDWLREKRIILFGRLISYFSRAYRLLCVSGRDWPLIPKTGKDQVDVVCVAITWISPTIRSQFHILFLVVLVRPCLSVPFLREKVQRNGRKISQQQQQLTRA